METSLPTAIVRSDGASLRAFGVTLLKMLAIGAVASTLAGLSFGAASAGCRNDAITYAKTVWPDAHCSSIETGCVNGSTDVAVCQVGTRTVVCSIIHGQSLRGEACVEVTP